MKPKGPYIKHVYWLTKTEETQLRGMLEASKTRLKPAKGVVCTPLDEINKIASVAPEVWGETCSRQGSWYRASEKNGLYLVISSFDLKGYGEKKTATITKSDFVPPRQAGPEEKGRMILDPAFAEKIPRAWTHVDDLEKRIYLRWAGRLGSDVADYDFLYLTHTANHANFVVPRFFIEKDHRMIPYSIDRSAHLCSCCLELFQIIGAEYPEKLIRPCPGACIFARLEPDQFLRVTGPDKVAER
ncbi:MAG: hypothetical protein ACOWYE_06065 [Desulfatiglandales bacterium]